MKNFFKGKEGFTLIELVIAMTILIIILMVTTTMFVSSSEVSGRISSSSEAQMACANMMERIRLLTVNSRELRIIDGAEVVASDGSTFTTEWANAVASEYSSDANVLIEKYTNKKLEEHKNLQKQYGYIVCGDPDTLTDGGITIYTPDSSGTLVKTKMYDQSNTTAVKLFTRLYKHGLSLTVKVWAVDKRYQTWNEFNAVGEAAAAAAADEDKQDAYEEALRDNCVFFHETEIVTENASITSRRKDGNTASQAEGRVLKFYIE